MDIKTHRRPNLTNISDYEQYAGAETVDRVSAKAETLTGLHVAHVNSTYYGGGVAELLSSLTLLMNAAGIKVGWRVLQGSPDFFSITKKMHNALQGADINLSDLKVNIYEDIIFENVVRNHLDHDIVIIHDPQPLAMINHYKKQGPWIWRCHIDLSNPNPDVWKYLKGFIETYDATILSIPEYRKKLDVPQMFFMPAINPFNIKNKEMSEAEIDERLDYYHIPTDLPLVVQISRFDRWKDPEGVIEAFKIARKEVDTTLVLLGDVATDDPDGERVYQSLLDQREERIVILSKEDTSLVNALQRKAAVVLQKSIREGFGLTVTEAMWKGTPVIGGNAGGIRHQIADGVNGFLVSSIDEASQRMVELLKDGKLRKRIGEQGRETVKTDFLLIRLLEQYLDLFSAFECDYKLDMSRLVEQ
ncbi:glycosyltransferase [candidate division WOR-3 bacterium]|uniref:Glycosyltransferase n=1 Tax=candidate division WOR-3 bacterium TaxID=2052148 RepID=A0A9D5KAF6_UNCW3|nr:glycosyltransferase [candidate division WOR-3 bacterium]MBD3365356.1 glycosyltransferase [candidate division WOR-3 bacterium]